MKMIILGALAAMTMAVAIPASVQQADAQPVVREKVVIKNGMHRHRHMERRRCFTERTRIQRPGGRTVIKTRRVCR
jgi:hypothetical protein